MSDAELRRLLRAASAAEQGETEMPFGFDTRVVALARAQSRARGNGSDTWELARLVRRTALVALTITACASAAAYWQIRENDDLGEPLTNAYAIADSAIDYELYQ
jgi:hypothetical protein